MSDSHQWDAPTGPQEDPPEGAKAEVWDIIQSRHLAVGIYCVQYWLYSTPTARCYSVQ